jgi:hypothetical protein
VGARWGVRWGDHWMIQWSLDGTLSLGVHLDPRTRQADAGGYGPYVDVHTGPVVVSLGNHPARAGDLERAIPAAVMRPEA